MTTLAPRPQRRLARLAVLGAAAVLTTGLGATLAPGAEATGSPVVQRAAAAEIPPVPANLEEFALQVAESINAARLNPKAMADDLDAMVPTVTGTGITHVETPGGGTIWTDKKYLEQSAQEARVQTVLQPLAWSEQLAKLGRDWLPYAPTQAHGDYGKRIKDAGVNAMVIEAIGGMDPNPKVFTYNFWVSATDGWKLNTPFRPDGDFGKRADEPGGVPWRGHRGIVNDNRMNAIGVACAPNTYPWDAKRPSVTCVLNAGVDLPDASPVTPAKEGQKPDLDKLPADLTGAVGTSQDGDGTLTVDTKETGTTDGSSASPQPFASGSPASADETASSDATDAVTPTDYPTYVDTAGPSGTPSDAAEPTDGVPGDLRFGETFDNFGDGSFEITVTAQDKWVPSDRATVYGTPAAEYRGYEVRYRNNSDKTFNLEEVARFSCGSAAGDQPLVIDPPGQGLPSGKEIKPHTAAVFAFGCGVGPTDYARVFARVGNELGNGAIGWYQK